VIITLIGSPGAGKSSVVNVLLSPFRAEEGIIIPPAEARKSVEHVTLSGYEYDIYDQKKDVQDLVLPKLVDFVGLSEKLLKEEKSGEAVVNKVITLLKGAQLSQDDYNFLTEMAQQPKTVQDMSTLNSKPQPLPKCSVALFVISAKHPPLPQLLQIMKGCRAGGIPIVIIVTHKDSLQDKGKGETLINELHDYSNKVHMIDARPGETTPREIREIWFSLLSACYSVK